MTKQIEKAGVLLTAMLMLAACEVGPDYIMPDMHVPDSWLSSPVVPPSTALVTAKPDVAANTQVEWWKNFNDSVLNQLIGKAVAGNFDNQIAEARINQSRAAKTSATADLLPMVNAMASGERQANRIAFPGGIDLTKPFNTFQAGFDASWELDIFGGKRRQLEVDTALVNAAEATRDDVRISLLAEVARTYVEIRQQQAQIALTNDLIKSQQATTDIIKQRVDVGSAPGLDWTQARAQLQQSQEQLPQLQSAVARSEFRLDMLLGAQPGTAHALVKNTAPIPSSDKKLVLDAPSKVIAQRPDIRAAERNLAAATAQQGVALAQFFPDISLSGFVGLLNLNMENLLRASSKSWSGGAAVLLPILNYGKLDAQLDQANAQQQEAMLQYRKGVIGALSDVEQSVIAYTKSGEQREAIAQTLATKKNAVEINRARQSQGLISMLDVLAAERDSLATQMRLSEADVQFSQNLIAVYKSLGGGWNAK